MDGRRRLVSFVSKISLILHFLLSTNKSSIHIQEQIYDEQDRVERHTHMLAEKVVRRWKTFVKRKHQGGKDTASVEPAMMAVVKNAVASAKASGKNDAVAVEEGMAAAETVAETTALLGGNSRQPLYTAGEDRTEHSHLSA